MLKPLALAAVLAAGPALAETVTVETYQGSVEVPVNPSFAVLDVGAADTLDALGVKPTGILSTLYVDYLDAFAEGAAPVGTLFEPDYEALAALDLDLIIAGGRSSDLTPELAKVTTAIDMTVWEDTPGQALARLAAYGRIFGKEREAAALAEAFNAKRAAAREAMADEGRALMLLTNGPKVSAFGSAGRFGWLFNALGLKEAVENVEEATHGEAISFEFIAEANPDVILVLDRLAATGQEGQSAEATLDNALVRGTNAWKTGKVLYLDGTRVYIANGGIQSLSHTFDLFTEAFGG